MTAFDIADWLKGVGVLAWALTLAWFIGIRPAVRAARRPDLDGFQSSARAKGAEDRAADAYSGRWGQGL